ncbi:MAG: hypothetical protein D6766_00635 [Verrucomicrobia bacterium]|nr:MAG: hypothetical protein D6766_00635 [Verrucomicrobiota bacterium]
MDVSDQPPLIVPRTVPTGLPRGWLTAVSWLGAAALAARQGFELPAAAGWVVDEVIVVLAALFGLDRVMLVVRHGRKPGLWRTCLPELLVTVGLGLGLLGLWLAPEAVAGLVRWLKAESSRAVWRDAIELFLLAHVGLHLLRAQTRLLGRVQRPEVILAGSFGLLILGGTLLLLLPRASADPQAPLGFLDALFTATSAACVTGLTVVDTGTALSALGQGIVLGLMQVGGLGIMVFVAFVAAAASRAVPVSHWAVFRDLVNARSLAEWRRLVRVMVGFTVAAEAAGAGLLYLWWPGVGEGAARLGWCVFHAVSAFCNAGFGLSNQSLAPWRAEGAVLAVMTGLIVLGGLGFPVVADVLRAVKETRWRRGPLARRWRWQWWRRLALQSRLALATTAILIVAGAALFGWLEAGGVLAGMSWPERLWGAVFQSVTARTAGFATVDIGSLQPATLLVLMALMVVGACPVSTGGGIKTVTLAVLVLTLRAMVSGRREVEVQGRALPAGVVHAALSVFVLYVAAAGLGCFLLAWTNPAIPLRDLAFETVSALSTVGLSTGITGRLDAMGRLVLCALMFIGRVGPLGLALAVFRGAPAARWRYPQEDLLVG